MTAARAAVGLWLEHLAKERRASPRTVEAYGFAAGRYIGFLETHRGEALTVADLGGITAGEIRAWLAHLRQGERPLSPRSLSQALSATRTFHRFLDRRMDTPNSAVALVRGPRVKRNETRRARRARSPCRTRKCGPRRRPEGRQHRARSKPYAVNRVHIHHWRRRRHRDR